MRDNHYSDTAFKEAVNTILARLGAKLVSSRSVAKWRRGEVIPRAVTQQAILELTSGAVTPTHFVTAVAAA